MSAASTYDRVASVVADVTSIPAAQLSPGSRWNEVGADSLDMSEILADCEVVFKIEFADADVLLLSTIGDLANLVERMTKVSA